MGRKKHEVLDIAKTSVSFKIKELEDYKKHANEEGFSFSRMIKVFFEDDIAHKKSCDTPAKKKAREKMKKRWLVMLDNKPR